MDLAESAGAESTKARPATYHLVPPPTALSLSVCLSSDLSSQLAALLLNPLKLLQTGCCECWCFSGGFCRWSVHFICCSVSLLVDLRLLAPHSEHTNINILAANSTQMGTLEEASGELRLL